MLELRGIEAGYGEHTVLRDVSVTVQPGTVVAVLGPNGAGKTTLLRVASGLLRPSAGTVLLGGEDVTRARPYARARRGLCHIPEGRGIYPTLTVRENLVLHAPQGDEATALDRAVSAFPVLGGKLRQPAGLLSGGQQQMLSLARAYLADPKVVIVDEASMGLAGRGGQDLRVSRPDRRVRHRAAHRGAVRQPRPGPRRPGVPAEQGQCGVQRRAGRPRRRSFRALPRHRRRRALTCLSAGPVSALPELRPAATP